MNVDSNTEECPVCGDFSVNGHSKNYGAFVCFSCKAFFRRIHQKEHFNIKTYICKKTGNCKITVTTRRSCQRCRYEKCISVGMDPSSVMTLEEKKKWFTKATFKRKKGTSVELESQSEKPYFWKEISNDKKTEITKVKENGTNKSTADQLLLVHYADDPRELFWKASKQTSLNPEFVSNVLSSFYGQSEINQDFFFEYMDDLSLIMKMFAFSDKDFLCLDIIEQKILLATNTPVFVSFILAKFIASPTPEEQLRWILGSHCPNLDPYDWLDMELISWERINNCLKLFNDSKESNRFAIIAKNLNNQSSFINHDDFGIICKAILHNTSHPKKKIFSKVKDTFLDTIGPEINELISISLDLNSMLQRTSRQHFCPFLTNTLDLSIVNIQIEGLASWLEIQLIAMEQQWSSINFGEDIVRECIMFSLGAPLSKRFMIFSFYILQERLKRFLFIHDEFQRLCQAEQYYILNSNMHIAQTLICAKAASCQNGEDQLNFTFGSKDKTSFSDLLQSIGHRKNNFPKIGMDSASEEDSKQARDHWKRFVYLEKLVGELTTNDTSLKVFLMLALLNNTDKFFHIDKLRNAYLNALVAKCEGNGYIKKEEDEDSDRNQGLMKGSMIVSKFFHTYPKMEELAMFMAKVRA